MLYLEDLHVGDRFQSREYEVSLEEILQFAEKFDPQPFHLDENLAREHPIFQGLAASGWHTSAIVMRLWTECVPIAGGLIGSDSHVRWPRPTRPNDKIRIEAVIDTITPSRSKNDRAIVSYTTKAFNQNDEIVFTSNTNIVVFKRERMV
ncbi:dehydratase [Acinetobacter sp. ANC 4558]|uniref:MaoC family dehydratase n=1 Tax=Acinetobacter sp. ANC 4558 TaxID=1977876 RepID=UPI000A3549FB|nr:MaoC family dehydratase [Acinetobacter sp. ANC 4558]OTG87013.1 dehydratase [Acinetobacter sp. ANC 4558]